MANKEWVQVMKFLQIIEGTSVMVAGCCGPSNMIKCCASEIMFGTG